VAALEQQVSEQVNELGKALYDFLLVQEKRLQRIEQGQAALATRVSRLEAAASAVADWNAGVGSRVDALERKLWPSAEDED
jgi:hypothetical protein